MDVLQDIEHMIRALEPGMALHASRHIIARAYNGTWIGIRDSCDELFPHLFKDADDAISRATSWRMSLENVRPGQGLRHIPQDLEEIDWMMNIIQHKPL